VCSKTQSELLSALSPVVFPKVEAYIIQYSPQNIFSTMKTYTVIPDALENALQTDLPT
jgi:cytochrome c biogenesis protein CcdA